MPSVGSPRMVDIVGEMPGKGGPVRIPISREFREWLLALWRRTGGDGDMVDDVTSLVTTNAALLASISGKLADVDARTQELEEYKALLAVRRLLGVSSYMKTVVDDTTASEAQRTLKLSRAKLDFIYG